MRNCVIELAIRGVRLLNRKRCAGRIAACHYTRVGPQWKQERFSVLRAFAAMPTPDEINRDRFYASDEDDEEYEVEPPDAEVLAAEERRAKEAVEATRMSINIDEIYREAGRERGSEILEHWLHNFRFRFQVKHLLVATAVLAIALTLWRFELLGLVVALLLMISVGGVFLYLQWQEKKQQDEANRRRQELYARRRAHFRQTIGTATGDVDHAAEMYEEPAEAAPTLPNEVDQTWQKALAGEKFRFRFSLRELMIAISVAAVILGIVQVLGGPDKAATLLGFVALGGLVIHALGFEPPGMVVLGWWLILVLYVLLSIVAAVWSGFA